MKWGTYKTLYERRNRGNRLWSAERWYSAARFQSRQPGFTSLGDNFKPDATRWILEAEAAWYVAKRPYYRIWPGVDIALLKTSLQIESEMIPQLPFPSLLLQVEHSRVEGVGFQSLMIHESSYRGTRWSVGLCQLDQFRQIHYYQHLRDAAGMSGVPSNPLENRSSFVPDISVIPRLFIAICILAANPDLIEPDYLNEDLAEVQEAQRRGDSPALKLLADRARRRGKLGFTVGRNLESCPHLRRPHLALYWTGKGGETPQILPRKGAVVNRKKLTEVPTGYLDNEVNS